MTKSQQLLARSGYLDFSFKLFAIACAVFNFSIRGDVKPDNKLAQSLKDPVVGSDQNARHGHADSDFKWPRKFHPSRELSQKTHDDPDFIRAWNRFTTIDDYKAAGKTNSAWDGNALAAFEGFVELRGLSGRSERSGKLRDEIARNATAAIKAGCDDPMVKCLHTEFAIENLPNATRTMIAKAWTDAAWALDPTEYSPFRKAYAFLRASEALKTKAGSATNQPPELGVQRMEAIFHLDEALHDPMMPPREACDVWWDLWENLNKNPGGHREIEKRELATLEQLWPTQPLTLLVKGNVCIKKAWEARGSGEVETVTRQGWLGFKTQLDLAESFLKRAWALDQADERIPVSMITVCTGLGYPRNEMEIWYERALKINPECYLAARRKALYLEPRWLGSLEDSLAFGRECVVKGQGRIPLSLAATHESLALLESRAGKDIDKSTGAKRLGSYWRQPGIWKDVHESYERFLVLNPNSRWERCHYARDAYRCGEFKAFIELLTLIDPAVTEEYFGGRSKLEGMIQTARERVKPQ